MGRDGVGWGDKVKSLHSLFCFHFVLAGVELQLIMSQAKKLVKNKEMCDPVSR